MSTIGDCNKSAVTVQERQILKVQKRQSDCQSAREAHKMSAIEAVREQERHTTRV